MARRVRDPHPNPHPHPHPGPNPSPSPKPSRSRSRSRSPNPNPNPNLNQAGFARLIAAVEEACQGDELLMRDLEEWRTRYFSPASVDNGLQLAWLLLALRRHHRRARAVGAAVRAPACEA